MTELERAAELGAERAIEKMMLLLGVDVHRPEDLKILRSDLDYARRLRQTSEKVGGIAWTVIVTAVVVGAVGFLAAGFKSALGGH